MGLLHVTLRVLVGTEQHQADQTLRVKSRMKQSLQPLASQESQQTSVQSTRDHLKALLALVADDVICHKHSHRVVTSVTWCMQRDLLTCPAYVTARHVQTH